jgi:hypothetical protein
MRETSQLVTQEEIQQTSVNDLPSLEDALGFKPYVDSIAAFLIDEHTRAPLTLSIEGEWGSGKSSFMKQLESVLRSKYEKKTVWFNAWRHDKDEALWASFALEFAQQISPPGYVSKFKKRSKLAWRRLDLIEGWPALIRLLAVFILCVGGLIALAWWLFTGSKTATGWLPVAINQMSAWLKGGIVATTALALSIPGAKRLIDFIGNPFQLDLKGLISTPSYQEKQPFLHKFHEDFQALVDVYTGPAVDKVFVFVDDLDRCELPKAAELMQALHLMIPENSKLVFILGMDRDKVAAGIAYRHANILPFLLPAQQEPISKATSAPAQALAFGHTFLERFIQIPFRIPKAEDRALRVLCKSLMQDPALRTSTTFFKNLTRKPQEETPVVDWTQELTGDPYAARTEPRTITLIKTGDADSQTIQSIVAAIAPALGHNPRRLKQFINAFRLNALIASEAGHLDTYPGMTLESTLTLLKLAKIVAIEIWWPRLLNDAEKTPDLLHRLEAKSKTSNTKASSDESPHALYWSSQPLLLTLLAVGLEAGPQNSIAKLDINKLRRLATRARRPSIAQDWRKRASAPWKPTAQTRIGFLLQQIAQSHEREAPINLKALFTTERAFLQEKDRYEKNFNTLGFLPSTYSDQRQPKIPNSDWIPGHRYIYTVELRGNEFYGYALGVSGHAKGIEYEIQSTGDWAGWPRRIAPAFVNSERYSLCNIKGENSSWWVGYPSTFANQGKPPDPQHTILQTSDGSASLEIRGLPVQEWKSFCENTEKPAHDSERIVLDFKRTRKYLSASGYAADKAFLQIAILNKDLFITIEIKCHIMTMTGYASVMKHIEKSIKRYPALFSA